MNTEFYTGPSTNDLGAFAKLVTPKALSPFLHLDLKDEFLFYQSSNDFALALSEAGVVFERSQTRAVTARIDQENKRASSWRSGKLTCDLENIDHRSSLKMGDSVALFQMDRPFLITDGIVTGMFAGNTLPQETVNAGAPGDYLVLSTKDLSLVVRVAKEWVERHITAI